MSISRTGFAAMLILSIAGLFLFPGTRILSPRNAVVIATILLVCSIMLIKSSDTIANRLLGFDIEREYFSEEGDRGTYFRQATPAIRDNLITGIGLNNWSYWITNRYASLTGYTTLNDRPMTAYTGTDIAPEGFGQAPPAHNLYLLTLTEVGLPGLVLFLLVIAHWLYSTGKSLFVRNRTLTGDFQVAAFFSLGATLMQSWTEWTFRQTNQFFLTHIIIAAALSISYMNLSKRPSLPRVSAQQVLNPDPRKATP